MRKIAFLWIAVGLLFSTQAESAFRYGSANSVAKRAAKNAETIAAEGTNFIPGVTTLALPVNPSEASSIFAYGVPTPDHPTGHPGIDFFCSTGAPIFASAAGKIGNIVSSPIPEDPDQKSIGINHGNNYTTFYTGSLQNILVSAGQQVIQGQKIAEVRGSRFTSFHWGLRQNNPFLELCPYEHVSAANKSVLEQLYSQSTSMMKSQYPLVCNSCNPPNGCR